MALMSHVDSDGSPYRVQVLDRALAALDVLAAHPNECSLVELCTALKLHKSTVHRLMMVLEQHRLVDKSPDNGKYRLGLKLFELGSKAIVALDVRELAGPYLLRLQRETQETVNLGVLDQGDVLYVAKIDSHQTLRMVARVGHRYPAYCTALGKAMLAGLSDDEVDAVASKFVMKAKTPTTLTTKEALKADLDLIRRRGYAIDDEENEQGARCVGAAVRDYMGQPRAAISVSAPAVRMDKSKLEEAARAVIRAALDLSRDLGYRRSEQDLSVAAAKKA